MAGEWNGAAARLALLREVRSRSTVLERARQGLGRDLESLGEEGRLLEDAREELVRWGLGEG